MPEEREDVEATLEQDTTPDAPQQKEKWRAIDWIVGATFGLELLLIIGWIIAQVIGWNPHVSSEHFTQFYFAWGLGFLSLGYIVLILWPIIFNIFKQGKGSKQDNDPRWFHARILSSGIVGGSYAFLLPVVMSLPEGNVNSGGAAALRQAILLATGGLIALIALGETRRKNDNDKLKNDQEKEKNNRDHIRQVRAERRERYTKAIEQLGNEKASIRTGGVYTLTRLVDDWLEEESLSKIERLKEGQVIINNLCAYIRSPFALASHYDELSKDSPTASYKDREQEFYTDKAIFDSEADTRLSIIKEIHDRLQISGENLWDSWSNFEYDFSGSTFFYPINLTKSYYKKSVNFSGSTYKDLADFSGSTYQGRANFGGSAYKDLADFGGSTYKDLADFSGSTYEKYAIFSTSDSTSTYQSMAVFSGSTYQSMAVFSGSTYQDQANFSGSTYQDQANFSGSTYQGEANFSGSTYQSIAVFSGSTYQDQANFSGSTYQGMPIFSSSIYKDLANFSGSTYRIEAAFSDSTYEKDVIFSTSDSTSTYQGMAVFSDSTYEGLTYFSKSTLQGETDFSGSIFYSDIYFGQDKDNGSFSRFTDCAPQFYDKTNRKNTLFGSPDNDFTVDTSKGYPINLNSEGLPLGCKFLTSEQKECLKGKIQEIEEKNNKLLEVKDPKEKAELSKELQSFNDKLHEWREKNTTVKAEDVAAENTES